MSFFSAALDRLLADHQILQADLSRMTGIKTGPMSRYLAGQAPAASALKKIVAALPKGKGELIAAWVKDALPAELRSGVTYVDAAGGSGARDVAAPPWTKLGTRERKLFEELARRCHENPKIRPLLEQVLEFSQPD